MFGQGHTELNRSTGHKLDEKGWGGERFPDSLVKPLANKHKKWHSSV